MRRSLVVVALTSLFWAGCQKATSSTSAVDASDVARARLCEHAVPADQCTRCDPSLVETFKALGDWCEAHGVPESHCKQCNPNLTFAGPVDEDWCSEHAVPESMCTKCNPKLTERFIAAKDFCREHGLPESVCPKCHPELPQLRGKKPPEFPEPGMRVRLASAETAVEAGIRTQRITPRKVSGTLEVVGHLTFNQNRLAQLTSRDDALVIEVRVDLGDEVKAGQPLVVLASGAVGEDQARQSAAGALVSIARTRVERERALVAQGLTPRLELEQAERELAEALANQSAARSSLAARGANGAEGSGRYLLRAPFAGAVVSRNAVAGRTASRDQLLIEIAALDVLWAELELPEADAFRVRAGQRVQLSLEGVASPPIESTIARVAPAVDPHTRTVRARVELDNHERRLKAGHFVRARIETSSPREALVVPSQALQWAEGTPIVFVLKGPGYYVPVRVKPGSAERDGVEIVEGLEAGMEVVTTGAFLLKTEILRDSIGAGCCEVDAPGRE